VKYAALRNRIAAIEAALLPRHVKITITGGLDGYAAPAARPPGSDLAKQAKLFRRPAQAPAEAAGASEVADPPELPLRVKDAS
jgi:hypothetical protein